MLKKAKQDVVQVQMAEGGNELPAPQEVVEPILRLITGPGGDDAARKDSSQSPGAGSMMAEPLPPMVDDPDFDLTFRAWFVADSATETEEVEKQEKALAARDQLHQAYLTQLEARVVAEGRVDPFEVYPDGPNVISLQGRYAEYVIAKKHNLKIQFIEVPFATREAARKAFVINVLRRPHLNEAQRCLLILAQREKEFSAKAKENQGTRTDLDVNSSVGFEPFNSTEAMAALAGVSYQTMSRVKVILKDYYKPEEEAYLDKAICRKYIQDLIEGEMSVNQAYRKYKEIKDAKDLGDDASAKQLPDSPMAASELLSVEPPMEESDSNSTSASEITIAPGITFGYEDPNFRPSSLRSGIRNRIECTENLAFMRQLPSEFIELVISSPDYNAPNVIYGGHEFLRHYDKYLEFLDERFVEIDRVMAKNSTFILNIGSVRNHYPEDRAQEYDTPIFADVIQLIRNRKLSMRYRTHYIWDKFYSFNKRKFISVPKDRRNFQTHEFLFVFTKGDWELRSDDPNKALDLSPAENEEIGTSVIRVVPQSHGKAGHPCPFPEKLIRKFILRYSMRNSLVADFWNGTGTVTAVAAQLGRDFLGCDIVPEYVQHARIRTEKARAKFQKGLQARLAERSTPPKGDGTSDAAA